MPNNTQQQGQLSAKSNCKSLQSETFYRGFTSIDQEMEREIAMQWFSTSGKSSFTDRNFLQTKGRK